MKPANDNVQDFLTRTSEIEQQRMVELLNQKIMALLELPRLLSAHEAMAAIEDSSLLSLLTRVQSTLQMALTSSSPAEKLSMTGLAVDTLLGHPDLNSGPLKRYRVIILRHFGEMANIAKDENAARKALALLKKG
jgi:hypothetical protein